MAAAISSSTIAIQQSLLQAVEYLLRCIQREESVLRDVKYLRDLLVFLPLTGLVHWEAHNRLRNAHRFLASHEPGAAGYELEALVCQLRSPLWSLQATTILGSISP